MTSLKKIDYIIVGQGLAGSCLALQFLAQKKRILVIDQPENNHSTAVAAGLFNPITGKMLAKTWQAELLFPYFFDFYRKAEKELGYQFFFPMPMYRPFQSIEEQNEWMGRSTHASMKSYIEKICLAPAWPEEVHDPVGGVLLKDAGFVDTSTFITAVRATLSREASFLNEAFDERILADEIDGVVYRDWFARKVIYCRGVDDWRNGCFSWLPIKPLKGETLLIRMQPVSRIYNKGVYVVPTGTEKRLYTVGSTYDFVLTDETTREGRMDLENKLAELLRVPYQIVGQNWGIRPTTPDRRVMIGTHPVHQNRVIFNGLGTKGVSLAPYYSGMVSDWLEGQTEIPREVNIRRFKSLYSKFE